MYQYARALHILQKAQEVEENLEVFEVKDFVFRREIEVELVQLITDLDQHIKIFVNERKLSKIDWVIGIICIIIGFDIWVLFIK